MIHKMKANKALIRFALNSLSGKRMVFLVIVFLNTETYL